MISSTIAFGVILGGTYALAALGLTVQYGIARIMNLAYGEFIVAAAFAAFVLVASVGLHPLLALAIVVPTGFIVSYLVYVFVLEALVRRSEQPGSLEVDSILVTFGLVFCVQGALLLAFGSDYAGYSFLKRPVDIFGATIAAGKVVGLLLAVAFGCGFYVLFARTRWGAAMRAVSTQPQFAPLVGVDVIRSGRIAFSIGGAMATAAGVILSMYQPFTATGGVFFTMKALIIVIMGGVGNLLGALLAGLMLGMVETAIAVAVDPGLTLAATYAIFLTVLVWRPAGLFGARLR